MLQLDTCLTDAGVSPCSCSTSPVERGSSCQVNKSVNLCTRGKQKRRKINERDYTSVTLVRVIFVFCNCTGSDLYKMRLDAVANLGWCHSESVRWRVRLSSMSCYLMLFSEARKGRGEGEGVYVGDCVLECRCKVGAG